MVNPLSVACDDSVPANVTTAAAWPPSMMVLATTAGSSGSMLRTVILLPRKLMFSYQVSGGTMTVSPCEAASMASCMVRYPSVRSGLTSWTRPMRNSTWIVSGTVGGSEALGAVIATDPVCSPVVNPVGSTEMLMG